MRELKFRAWNTEAKIMIDLQKVTPLALAINPAIVGARTGVYVPDDDRIIVMQFTGLRDKNGREIFEGDVVKWGHNVNTIGAGMGVCFDGGFEEGTGKVEITPLGIFFGDTKALWDMDGYLENSLDENIGELEIAGNIYDNPELVKP